MEGKKERCSIDPPPNGSRTRWLSKTSDFRETYRREIQLILISPFQKLLFLWKKEFFKQSLFFKLFQKQKGLYYWGIVNIIRWNYHFWGQTVWISTKIYRRSKILRHHKVIFQFITWSPNFFICLPIYSTRATSITWCFLSRFLSKTRHKKPFSTDSPLLSTIALTYCCQQQNRTSQ